MKKIKPKVRIPMPKPGRPHGTKKGKKGYTRQKEKIIESDDLDATVS